MIIQSFFTDGWVPKTWLSATIKIRDISNWGVLVDNVAMTEVWDGFYKYDFTTYDKDKEYWIVCDGSDVLEDSDRYSYAWNDNYWMTEAEHDKLMLTAEETNATSNKDTIISEVNVNENKIDALNDFDPVNDVVARVTLTDTVTVNTDMRGTDWANTIAPDNTSISSILSDTNELQQNQWDWATATGFATEIKQDIIDSNVDDIKSTIDTNLDAKVSDTAKESVATTNKNDIITEINENETKIDAVQAAVDLLHNYDDTVINEKLDELEVFFKCNMKIESNQLIAYNDEWVIHTRDLFDENWLASNYDTFKRITI